MTTGKLPQKSRLTKRVDAHRRARRDAGPGTPPRYPKPPKGGWFGTGLNWHPVKGPINPKADQPVPPAWKGPPVEREPNKRKPNIHRIQRMISRKQGAPTARQPYRKTVAKGTIIRNAKDKPRSA